MQTTSPAAWATQFGNSTPDGSFLSADGSLLVQIITDANATRMLRSEFLQLAMRVRREPGLRRAILALELGRLSPERALREWQNALAVLSREISSRLALLIITDTDLSICHPDDDEMQAVAARYRSRNGSRGAVGMTSLREQPGQKYYEVLKVLLLAWLKCEPPLSHKELAARVGCSHPTLREAINHPLLRKQVLRTSNRAVQLAGFPREAWNEMVAASPARRQTRLFVDVSGTRPSPEDLCQRLQRFSDNRIALGGVVAARHWDNHFDLNGTPRVDIVLHAPDGDADLSFVQRVDPALKPLADPEGSAILAVHPLYRRDSAYAVAELQQLPVADVIETALDLYELKLPAQAAQLLKRQRHEVRL